MIENMQPGRELDKSCVFCNGAGKFQHISGRWYRCYCVKEDTNE